MTREKFNLIVSAEKLPAVKDIARVILEFRGIVHIEVMKESSKTFCISIPQRTV